MHEIRTQSQLTITVELKPQTSRDELNALVLRIVDLSRKHAVRLIVAGRPIGMPLTESQAALFLKWLGR